MAALSFAATAEHQVPGGVREPLLMGTTAKCGMRGVGGGPAGKLSRNTCKAKPRICQNPRVPLAP